MSAIRAKSARARATIAARIYKERKPSIYGDTDFGRSLDHCFESGDGWSVCAWLIHRIVTGDTEFLEAVLRHHPGSGEWCLKRACVAWKCGDVATVKAEFDKCLEASAKRDSSDAGWYRDDPTPPRWPIPDPIGSVLFQP